MIRNKFALLVASLALSSSVFAQEMSQQQIDAIDQRTKPVGDVYISGNEPAAAEVVSEPRDGASVYKTYCTTCHSTGISGAPKTGDGHDWAPRLAKGMDTLKEHAINGFNAMPAKGTCSNCSDDEIVAAIKHMTQGL